jgi:hypothetical protein
MDAWPTIGVAPGAAGADTGPVRVRYAIGGIAAAALIALPASAPASHGGHRGAINGLAAQQCAQERADIGKKAFRKKYGAKHTMRTCTRRIVPQVASAVGTANSDCQDELAQGGVADFIDSYGDDALTPVDAAMQECVAEDVDVILNPCDYVDDGTDDGTDA